MSPVLFTSYNFWQKLRYAVSRESGAIFDEDETFGRTRRGYSRRLGAVFFLLWCGARLGRLVAVAAPSASHFACAYPK
jgi:hypothetical protein